ncbi:MAG: leucine-rich repeat protein [Clostridiales bacterium]|jgi:hypothetical protein|nr:leucine-rich repeat protein [Clostridiales bacterium]
MKKIKSIILVILLCALLTAGFSSCLISKIKFVSDGELIYEVVVTIDGMNCDAPVAPEKPGYTFICWKSSTAIERAGTNISILKSDTFYAVWEKSEIITEEPNGLFYRKIDGGYEIAAYLGWASSLTLPSDYNGEKLISIDKEAFLGSQLREIILPETITHIGESAFRRSRLLNIIIPDGVTKIADETFQFCYLLQSVFLPDGLTEIGSRAFGHCVSLWSITIPDGVTKIADETFRYCTELRQITLPKGLTEIGAYAFRECTSADSIDIPYGVYIKKRAFEMWKSNQTIYIHGKSYGSIFRFSGCKAKRVLIK